MALSLEQPHYIMVRWYRKGCLLTSLWTRNSLLTSKSHRVPLSLPRPQCLDYIHIAMYCFYRCWGPQLGSPSCTISNKEEEWERNYGLRIFIRTIHHDVRPLIRSHFLKIAPFPTTPQAAVTMIVAVGLWGMVAIQAKALYEAHTRFNSIMEDAEAGGLWVLGQPGFKMRLK